MSVLLALLLFPTTFHFNGQHLRALSQEKPIRSMDVTQETPFFHAAPDAKCGTDYLILKGNRIALIRAEDSRSIVKLPTGQYGIVTSAAIAPARNEPHRSHLRHFSRKVSVSGGQASCPRGFQPPRPAFRY